MFTYFLNVVIFEHLLEKWFMNYPTLYGDLKGKINFIEFDSACTKVLPSK